MKTLPTLFLTLSLSASVLHAAGTVDPLLPVDQTLMTAVQRNDLGAVKTAVAEGADANIKASADGVAVSPLHYAVQNLDLSMVQYLLSEGAKQDLLDEYDRQTLAFIIENKTSIDDKKLLDAAGAGKRGEARALIEQGANVNVRRTTAAGVETPLGNAVSRVDEEMVELLLSMGAKKELLDETGRHNIEFMKIKPSARPIDELLVDAAKKNDLAAVVPLIAQGANPDFENPDVPGSAFFWAVARLNKPLVEYLLQHGANAKLLSPYGQKTLDYLLTGNKDGMLRLAGRKTVTPEQRRRASEKFLSKLPAPMKAALAASFPDFIAWSPDDYIQDIKGSYGPTPFYTTGDFNGDGIPDAALSGYNGDVGLLVALLSAQTGYTAETLRLRTFFEPLELCQTFRKESSHSFYPEFGLISGIKTQPAGTVIKEVVGSLERDKKIAFESISLRLGESERETYYWENDKLIKAKTTE